MAIDRKYGRVELERGTIGEHEPVVVFRAQDKLLLEVLTNYYRLCDSAGSPANHLDLISETCQVVAAWQENHFTQTPQSAEY